MLDKGFSLSELDTLCWDLGVDPEDIAGTTKSARTREIASHFRRDMRLDRLENEIKRVRPRLFSEGDVQPALRARAVSSPVIADLVEAERRGSRHKIKNEAVYDQLNNLLQDMSMIDAGDIDVTLGEFIQRIQEVCQRTLNNEKARFLAEREKEITRNFRLNPSRNSSALRPSYGEEDENTPIKDLVKLVMDEGEELEKEFAKLDIEGLVGAYQYLVYDKFSPQRGRLDDKKVLYIPATVAPALQDVSRITREISSFLSSRGYNEYLELIESDFEMSKQIADYLSELATRIERVTERLVEDTQEISRKNPVANIFNM